jgi:hypothetical protein
MTGISFLTTGTSCAVDTIDSTEDYFRATTNSANPEFAISSASPLAISCVAPLFISSVAPLAISSGGSLTISTMAPHTGAGGVANLFSISVSSAATTIDVIFDPLLAERKEQTLELNKMVQYGYAPPTSSTR